MGLLARPGVRASLGVILESPVLSWAELGTDLALKALLAVGPARLPPAPLINEASCMGPGAHGHLMRASPRL